MRPSELLPSPSLKRVRKLYPARASQKTRRELPAWFEKAGSTLSPPRCFGNQAEQFALIAPLLFQIVCN